MVAVARRRLLENGRCNAGRPPANLNDEGRGRWAWAFALLALVTTPARDAMRSAASFGTVLQRGIANGSNASASASRACTNDARSCACSGSCEVTPAELKVR